MASSVRLEQYPGSAFLRVNVRRTTLPSQQPCYVHYEC